jgi:peptidoglycan-associated lipoprotein
MSRLLLGAVLSGSLLMIQHDPADACGLKLSVNAANVNKPVKPTRNPSRVLVLGDAPDSVSRELKQAGHVVESADGMDSVKNRDFQVVLVSNESDVKRAQDQWTTAQVLPLKRRTRDNVTLVETAMARKPIDTATGDRREVVAAGPNEDKDRVPKRTGEGSDEDLPAEETEEIAAVEKAPEPKPVEKAPEPVAKAEPKPEPKKAPPPPVVEEEEEEEEEVEEKPVLAARAEPVRKEPKLTLTKAERTIPQPEEKKSNGNGAKGLAKSVRFELASTRLSAGAKKALDKHARYLKSNSDATILIEGHTDEVGSDEVNMILARHRADNAKTYLTRMGVDESRISTEAFGESNPPFPPSSNPKNRCIIIKQQ